MARSSIIIIGLILALITNELFGQNQNYLEMIVPDFQVNDNIGESTTLQYDPVVGSDENGNFVVVWYDTRDGNGDLYGQLINNTGEAIGKNFKINDLINCAKPAIAVARNGDFIVCWKSSDIYARYFNSDGYPLGNSFKVNSDNSTQGKDFPHVAVNDDGNFVITWSLDLGNKVREIKFQKYLADGCVPIGDNETVLNNTGSTYKYFPKCCFDSEENILFIWADRKTNDTNIMGQYYTNSGVPIGTNIQINDINGLQTYCNFPALAYNKNHFLAVWSEYIEGVDHIIGEFLYPDETNKTSDNFFISDSSTTIDQLFPSVTSDIDNNFIVSWLSYDDIIQIQHLDSNGNLIGDNIELNEKASDRAFNKNVDITSTPIGNTLIVWEDNGEIYADFQLEQEEYQLNNFKINDDDTGGAQLYPKIACDNEGNFIVVWKEKITWDKYSVWAQIHNANGEKIGENIKISTDSSEAIHYYLSVTADYNNQYIVSWTTTDYQLCLQKISKNGELIDNNLFILENASDRGYDAKLNALENGNIVLTWYNSYHPENGSSRESIRYQVFTKECKKIGEIQSLYEPEEWIYEPGDWDFDMDIHGNSTLFWEVRSELHIQQFNTDFQPIGEKVTLESENTLSYPSVSTNKTGRTVLIYSEDVGSVPYENMMIGHWRIHCRIYDSDGTLVQPDAILIDSTNNPHTYRVVKVDNTGKFLFMTNYLSRENVGNVSGMFFNEYGNLITTFQNMTQDSNEYQQRDPHFDLLGNKIYCTWWDDRAQTTEYDVWTNILEYNLPSDIEQLEIISNPEIYQLRQNYPNPFNPSTMINYQLAISNDVQLEVYNILGENVAILVSEKQQAGNYSVNFDATGLSSGIYFYRLQVGNEFVETKKMMFLK